MIEVAIVGGDPAGSCCAYNLAESGICSVIFDHTHPREKPCGRMISPVAQELFPFLNKLPIEHRKKRKICLLSPSGRKTKFSTKRSEIRCFSRLKLDQHLVNWLRREFRKTNRECSMSCGRNPMERAC